MTKDDKAGLYLTVIIHLAVLIALLSTSIGIALSHENIFEVDYSKEAAPEIPEGEQAEEEMTEEEAFDQEISSKVDALIAGNSGVQFRNIPSGGELRDDRGTDADKLYDDARKLASELRNGYEIDEPDDDYAAVSSPDKNKNEEKAVSTPYSGPSVLSWQLDGRMASHLPIPAYRCYGGGMVTVIIAVDPAGRVVSAKIQEETSSTDKCLREFAKRAAMMSRFSSKPGAPARQPGQIIYQFIAQ